MEIDWNAEIVDQMDSHWRYQLRPRLVGLTDAEFFWEPEPGCWSLRRRGETSAPVSLGVGEFRMDYAEPPHDDAPVTTIAWRLAHMIANFGDPTVPHFKFKDPDTPTIDFAGSAEAALRQLDDGYEAWMAEVRGLGVAGLMRPQGALSPPQFADAPVARLVMYGHVEVIHHGAEVCLLRDLYASTTQHRSLRFGPVPLLCCGGGSLLDLCPVGLTGGNVYLTRTPGGITGLAIQLFPEDVGMPGMSGGVVEEVHDDAEQFHVRPWPPRHMAFGVQVQFGDRGLRVLTGPSVELEHLVPALIGGDPQVTAIGVLPPGQRLGERFVEDLAEVPGFPGR